MTILDALKTVGRTLKESGKIDEYQKIIDLQGQIQDLIQENWELKCQVKEFEEKWSIKEDLEFRENAYWRKSGEGPFCMPCWDDKKKLMRMAGSKGHFHCPTCQYGMVTDEEQRHIDAQFKNWNSGC